MKKWIVLVVLVLCFASCNLVSVSLTEDQLQTMQLEDFTKSENALSVIVDDKTLEIKNIVSSGINSNGIEYYFLSTDTKNKQLLIVLNTELKKLQWSDYYLDYSFFDPEELLAFVVDPFEERHLSASISVHDFKLDFFDKLKESFTFRPGSIKGNKQLYYLKPVFVLSEGEYRTYEIEWTQANFCFHRTYYTLFDGKQGRGSELDDGARNPAPIDELIPLTVTSTTQPLSGYTTFAQNENENYVVSFVAPAGSDLNWSTCEIVYTDKKTGQSEKERFSNIFEYQDKLMSITPAKNKDKRIAFIIDTKEFPYDFYFDPKGEGTDIFLRPSSFVRLYPK